MGEFKIVLGYDDRELKGYQGKEGRTARIYQIMTRDSLTFIIGDYEVTTFEDIPLKKDSEDKNMSGIIEVEGQYYKRFGNGNEKYHSDFNRMIDCYIENWKLHIPNYDVVDVKTAIKFYKELKQLKSKLLSLDVD